LEHFGKSETCRASRRQSHGAIRQVKDLPRIGAAKPLNLIALVNTNQEMRLMKTNALIFSRRVTICGVLALLSLTAFTDAFPQTPPQQKPATHRPLPKPVAGARGFDQFAKRDASARLIAVAGTRVIVEPPGDHFAKGEAYYKAGKYEAAAKELRESVKVSPDWDDPHYVLALSLTELGQLKEAIEEFKQTIRLAIKDDPKILSYYNIGNAYSDLGQYKEAIEAYRQAIKLNANSSNPQPLSKPHNNLGLAYAALGQLTEAVSEFNQAAQLKPDYPEAHYNLGVAYVQQGRKPEAREQLRILTKLNPEMAAKLQALIKK
jgi:Flp pilus assembly protein TadD